MAIPGMPFAGENEDDARRRERERREREAKARREQEERDAEARRAAAEGMRRRGDAMVGVDEPRGTRARGGAYGGPSVEDALRSFDAYQSREPERMVFTPEEAERSQIEEFGSVEAWSGMSEREREAREQDESGAEFATDGLPGGQRQMEARAEQRRNPEPVRVQPFRRATEEERRAQPFARSRAEVEASMDEGERQLPALAAEAAAQSRRNMARAPMRSDGATTSAQARQEQRMPGARTEQDPLGASAMTNALGRFQEIAGTGDPEPDELQAQGAPTQDGLDFDAAALVESYPRALRAVDAAQQERGQDPNRQAAVDEARQALGEYHADDGADDITRARRRARALKALGAILQLGLGIGAAVAGARDASPYLVGALSGAGKFMGQALGGNRLEQQAIGDQRRAQQAQVQQTEMELARREQGRREGQGAAQIGLTRDNLERQRAADAQRAAYQQQQLQLGSRRAESTEAYQRAQQKHFEALDADLRQRTALRTPGTEASRAAVDWAASVGANVHPEMSGEQAYDAGRRHLDREARRRGRRGTGTGGGGNASATREAARAHFRERFPPGEQGDLLFNNAWGDAVTRRRMIGEMAADPSQRELIGGTGIMVAANVRPADVSALRNGMAALGRYAGLMNLIEGVQREHGGVTARITPEARAAIAPYVGQLQAMVAKLGETGVINANEVPRINAQLPNPESVELNVFGTFNRRLESWRNILANSARAELSLKLADRSQMGQVFEAVGLSRSLVNMGATGGAGGGGDMVTLRIMRNGQQVGTRSIPRQSVAAAREAANRRGLELVE